MYMHCYQLQGLVLLFSCLKGNGQPLAKNLNGAIVLSITVWIQAQILVEALTVLI